MTSQFREAAGWLLFRSMDEDNASIWSASEVYLASRHDAQEIANRFGNCNLSLGCNCRCHDRTRVRNDLSKVLLCDTVFKELRRQFDSRPIEGGRSANRCLIKRSQAAAAQHNHPLRRDYFLLHKVA